MRGKNFHFVLISGRSAGWNVHSASRNVYSSGRNVYSTGWNIKGSWLYAEINPFASRLLSVLLQPFQPVLVGKMPYFKVLERYVESFSVGASFPLFVYLSDLSLFLPTE